MPSTTKGNYRENSSSGSYTQCNDMTIRCKYFTNSCVWILFKLENFMEMATCIRKVASEEFGVSRGTRSKAKDT
jgi:hypothetical protein